MYTVYLRYVLETKKRNHSYLVVLLHVSFQSVLHKVLSIPMQLHQPPLRHFGSGNTGISPDFVKIGRLDKILSNRYCGIQIQDGMPPPTRDVNDFSSLK